LTITLVDYGLGNIQAFVSIYSRINVPVAIAKDERTLAEATKVVLPGVGAFDWAMSRLQASGMRECLDDLVLFKKRPVLGICVGMQIMAERSDEGNAAGLGWFDAAVKRLPRQETNEKVHLPHMGWNDVEEADDSLFRGIASPRFYFLHSFYFSPADASCVLAKADYHGGFAAAVRRQNIYGVQFHPEKSHHWGVQLLRNFADL